LEFKVPEVKVTISEITFLDQFRQIVAKFSLHRVLFHKFVSGAPHVLEFNERREHFHIKLYVYTRATAVFVRMKERGGGSKWNGEAAVIMAAV